MKITGNEPAIPDNLRAYNAAFRAAEIEFSRTGVWSFVPPGKLPAPVVAIETKDAA